MFCPSCGGEFREGFARCADCDVELVAAAPASAAEHPEPAEMTTVFGTGDPVLLITAKAVLDDAGIPYLIRNEELQSLFGIGRLGTGFSVVAGPMEIQVGADRWQEAADLLREAGLELAPGERSGDENEEVEEQGGDDGG